MAESTTRTGQLIKFLRRRDYKLVKELGQGACGQTVLLLDEQIDEHFVCKKYVPYSEAYRQELFSNFVREIKLLHKVHHENVVRVFNYYLYPDQFAGYILMEFVDGSSIDDFLAKYPEMINELFLQAITGFGYLERAGILHRDIRPANLMVRADGTLKIIDLGFGKRIESSNDFDKSITLNWWCEPPNEFKESKYDFRTEVYFVGKLFGEIIQQNSISHFKYSSMLSSMCELNPSTRIQRFSDIEKMIRSEQFFEIEFSEEELYTYRTFAEALCTHFAKIEQSAKYTTDIAKIQTQLNDAYRGFMLEREVPNASVVLRCFVVGTYYYKEEGLDVWIVREFLKLLKSSTEEKKRIILGNLHTKLDAVPRYVQPEEEEVPF